MELISWLVSNYVIIKNMKTEEVETAGVWTERP